MCAYEWMDDLYSSTAMVSPLFVTNTPPMDCFSEVKSIACFPVTIYPVSIPSQILA